MADELDAAKRSLRDQIQRALRASGSAGRAAASEHAQARLLQSDQAAAAKVIALYRATPSECSTDALCARLQAAGKEVCFPAVRPDELTLRFLRPHAPPTPGQLGMAEHPDVPTERVPLESIDLFVVPARAVDAQGHRLGRGKGYYDATLSAAGPRAARVCLVFDAQVVEAVPHGPHDQRVDAVCTETRWLDCPGRRR